MRPSRDREAVVDIVDVLLEEGAVVSADVLITVAGVPLVGLRARLLLAGMTEMTEHGIFEDWDRAQRDLARGAETGTNTQNETENGD